MEKKHNDDSTHPQDWTTKKLKREALLRDRRIHCEGGFRAWDVLIVNIIIKELNERGIEAVPTISFHKEVKKHAAAI